MRYLYTMVRVTDSDESLHVYCELLGLKETRRMENDKGRFTLFVLAANDDFKKAGAEQPTLIELTYNWDKEKYTEGRN